MADAPTTALPPLENGDHLDQKTFHARYEAMPDHVKAELIEGIVYIMPSPLKPGHGRSHGWVMTWLGVYAEATPGTDIFDNTTTILSSSSEPQPDACLLVLPEYGGQTRENQDGYLTGPPELIVEVASSSQAIDLGAKRRDYERAGVREYVVIALRQAQVFWFVRRADRFEPMLPGPDGVLRSEAFPGLWLDPAGVIGRDTRRLLEVLRQGLASPEHAAFMTTLAARRAAGDTTGTAPTD
jgi:Uma2 family endonuclease